MKTSQELTLQHTSYTLDYLHRTPLPQRKSLGQYMTPETIREALVSRLPGKRYRRVLDPGVGTGEFLISVRRRFPRAELHGWDVDPEVLKVARKNITRAKLVVRDALKAPSVETFDLVIGNPPYYEFKPSEDLRKAYGDVISGRPNIFALFFKAGLNLLSEGGVLAYVVPTSMNNGAYFAALREHILKVADIHSFDVVSGTDRFIDAQQSVMGIVLIKTSTPKLSPQNVFEKNGLRIFTRDSKDLESLYARRKTLGEMGFRVSTGQVVWNQRKDDLTNDPQGAVPLLWAHNIGKDGELVFPVVGDKPQYVRNVTGGVGPAVIVNRITGAGEKALLRAALVPAGMRFVAENHANVVTAPEGTPVSAYRSIIEQLRSERTRDFARKLTGNTQISKTELERIIPFDPVEGAQRQLVFAGPARTLTA